MIPELSENDSDTLRVAPALIFLVVAAADGKVGKKEMAAFLGLMARPEDFGSPLLVSIAAESLNDMPAIITRIMDGKPNFMAELERIRVVIDVGLPARKATQFKLALLMLGKAVAEASGGFLGIGRRVTKEERIALAAIAMGLGITSL